MAKSQTDFATFETALIRLGMAVFGTLTLREELVPEEAKKYTECEAILVGNVGGNMWEMFSQSEEHFDSLPDALDRWTHREIDVLAEQIGSTAVYPSNRPYWPFQKLAGEACGMKQSPLGMFIHPEYGLWQAYRALLIFEPGRQFLSHFKKVSENPEKQIHPCDFCESKPCLRACPVDAFRNGSLSVDPCFGHLESGDKPDCMLSGCNARNACPVGVSYRYPDAQLQFHMNAFKK